MSYEVPKISAYHQHQHQELNSARSRSTSLYMTQSEQDTQTHGRPWAPLTNSMGPPSLLPPYAKDNALIKAPSRSPSPSASNRTPSKPTEWVGFQVGPNSHGRSNSFDTNMSSMSSFPKFGLPASVERQNSSSSEHNKQHDVVNKDRRSASSPENMRQSQQSSQIDQPQSDLASTGYRPSTATSIQSQRTNSFAGFHAPFQSSATSATEGARSSPSALPKGISVAPDPRRHGRQVATASSPFHSPASTKFSPQTQPDYHQRSQRSSRPASPMSHGQPWSPKPLNQLLQHRPQSRTASPLSSAHLPRYDAPPSATPAAGNATTTSRYPMLQPAPPHQQLQLQHAGQHGHQPILPAPADANRRSSAAAGPTPPALGPSSSLSDPARRYTPSTTERPASHNSREPASAPAQTHTGVFKLGSEPFSAYQTPTQLYQYPPYPPQQGSQASGTHSRSRNKEPKVQGQLRWQHYVDMPSPGATATKSMNPMGPGPPAVLAPSAPSAPSAVSAASSGGRYTSIAPAPPDGSLVVGHPPQFMPLARGQSAESNASGQAGSAEESRKQADKEKERRAKNLQQWTQK